MRDGARISVIIPALNEVNSIGDVIDAIPEWVDDIIVGDNGSNDGTPEMAEVHGARVVYEPRRGYGSACLRAMTALESSDIVVFLDADFSDHPDQMDRIVDPILRNEVDLVIGSRALGNAEPGALTPQARFGNRLACFLMRVFWGVRFTDLGPFRAIRYTSLLQLGMADPNYGWTVEMQIKATLHRLRATEVPVDYSRRIGRSKVSGTVRGVIGAGYKILGTIFVSAFAYHVLRGKRNAGREHLIVFTRYPEPGQTKTRLIPELGPEGAAELQQKMTEHTLDDAKRAGAASLTVQYTGATHDQMAEWLGASIDYREQVGEDLGARMANAFTQAFAAGATRVVLVGVDCPEITPGILHAAFDVLKRRAVVLGPATDGGYYLVGLRKDIAESARVEMFQDIEWGTDRVLRVTLAKLAVMNLSPARLAPLDDVDRPEDLEVWERARNSGGSVAALSVIIPTMNEADCIEETLERVTREPGVDLIVVDGGSTDKTCEIARAQGARVFETADGRAAQLNLGAAKARGRTLLFLHADTMLPVGYATEIERCLARAEVAAGAFEFSIHEPDTGMKIVAALTNLRSHALQLPYGDQGIFVRKNVFREMGGFRAMPIMEDFEFIRRAKRRGRIAIAHAKAETSGRRWRTLGVLRTTLINQVAVMMYFFGVSPERIAAYYRRPRTPS